VFVPDGDLLVPTLYAQGPWDPRALHGGPPVAALARATEALETPGPMRIARITTDLVRVVPMAPLRATARVMRSGRRIQAVDATLEHAGTVVARATVIRVRVDDSFAPMETALRWPDGPMARPGEAVDGERWELVPPGEDTMAGVLHAMERTRFTHPGPGRGRCWCRLAIPLVLGEPTSPMAAMAVVADMASGMSAGILVDFDRFTFQNVDLTLHLRREPRPGWIGLDAAAQLGPEGVGQVQAVLVDDDGPFGHVLQSLLIERRPPAP
jgi:hypothetical protein